jgi:Uma2 family endonuclease
MGLPQEKRIFTYADYKDWDLAFGERFELINGVAYGMAAPSVYHQSILGELFRQLANYLTDKPCKVFPAPFDVRLFYEEDESDDTVVQPDISVVCNKDKLGKEGCHGAPDFVAEILSPSNTATEMQQKFDLYREAGVREYWVLSPDHKKLHAYHFKDGWIIPRTYRATDTATVEIFPELLISLEAVFSE